MADGIRLLLALWSAAWQAGRGPDADPAQLGAIPASEVDRRCNDRAFLPSLDLDHIAPALRELSASQAA